MKKENVEKVLPLLKELAGTVQDVNHDAVFSIISREDPEKTGNSRVDMAIGGSRHAIVQTLASAFREHPQVAKMVVDALEEARVVKPERKRGGEAQSIKEILDEFMEELEAIRPKGKSTTNGRNFFDMMDELRGKRAKQDQTEGKDDCDCPACQVRRSLMGLRKKTNPNVN